MAKQITQITEEQKLAIENYGSEIKTLEDFTTACRLRPGQFIGPIKAPGFLNMIREIFQNSIDQMIDPTSPCNFIRFYYNENTLEVFVEDNGKGFPFNDIIRILSAQYTSKNYTKKLFEYSSGMNGIGSKVVNALSTVFAVESYKYNGEAVRVEFNKGYLVDPKPQKIPNKEKKQGSRVYFIPDPEVMGEMNLPWKTVYSLIRDIMSLTPLGSSMDFEAIDKNGVSHKEMIVNNDGIIANLIMKVKNPLNKPIIVGFDDGTHKLEAAFCYDGGDITGPSDTSDVTSYCNFCPTKEGTHIDGTIEGIARWFSRYMNTVFLTNQKSKTKTVVTFNDIKAGLNIMISAAHLEPVFTGQAKEILSNDDMIPFCKDVVMKGLDEWSKSNPQDLNKLSKYFKDIADARMKMDKEKVKIVTKYQANVLTGLPSKYAKPTERCDELLIVEGDSAGGSAKSGRDEKTQGIFPIRGKIPSAFEKTRQAFWDNAETQGIAKIILNKEYTRNFDPINDVKWQKIIFMVDADVDRRTNCPKMLYANQAGYLFI